MVAGKMYINIDNVIFLLIKRYDNIFYQNGDFEKSFRSLTLCEVLELGVVQMATVNGLFVDLDDDLEMKVLILLDGEISFFQHI